MDVVPTFAPERALELITSLLIGFCVRYEMRNLKQLVMDDASWIHTVSEDELITLDADALALFLAFSRTLEG